jgi:hypothetical protein
MSTPDYTKPDYTKSELEWLVAEAKSAARRNASEILSWHVAFAIGLLEAAKRIVREEPTGE